ncbi:MAG TPA: class I SAM-dependent methyltransferase [Polyangiaceae bacterium]|nr:class I SAM-dependent methyltransferase [Polyangiaceae bacterium]
MSKCLISGADTETFLSFGRMPIANGFLDADQFGNEHFFELKVGYCPESKMVQLTELVERERMFHENYAFFSSTSRRMAEHFGRFAGFVESRYLEGSSDPFVVEIGSNDGIMLQHFAGRNVRHLGIEPSANVAKVAIDKGIRTISEFFDEALARRIVAEHGQADAFMGANVMCHIPYMHSVMAGVRLLLKPTGVLVFEDPYLGDIVEKTSYDQIYDEHAFYFSVASVEYLVARHELELIDVIAQPVHGGSMRYVIGHRGARPVSENVSKQRRLEQQLGLDRAETYQQFARQVAQSKQDLMTLLGDLKRQGKRVAAYGATSKSTTVTNYCGITPELVEYISDTTPIKQGKFSPGAHIPVVPHERFASGYPDCALLFAWNHAQEIMAKEQAFRDQGGKFILYVPKVHLT